MAKKKELKRELRLNKALLEHALWMRKAIERDFERAVGKTWEDWSWEEWSKNNSGPFVSLPMHTTFIDEEPARPAQVTQEELEEFVQSTDAPEESPIASGEVVGTPAWIVPPPVFEGEVVGFGLPAKWVEKPRLRWCQFHEPPPHDPVEDEQDASAERSEAEEAADDVFKGAPDWANYWAQDDSGMCYWYDKKPLLEEWGTLWFWDNCTTFMEAPERPRSSDWTKTLVARPKKENPSEEGYVRELHF